MITYTSEQLDQIAPALVKAQSLMSHANQDGKNPHFKSKYATLHSVIDTVKQHLNSNGIAIIQPVSGEGKEVQAGTRLLHESGQWIECVASATAQKGTAQEVGSIVTYLRRYTLAAMCGIGSDDDDDGNASKQAESEVNNAQQRAGAALQKLKSKIGEEAARSRAQLIKSECNGDWVKIAETLEKCALSNFDTEEV